MTTLRADADPREYASALISRPGVPWWAAVVIAFVPTAAGFTIDLAANGTVGVISWVLTLLGIIAAGLAVRRHSLFTAMVQPPLVVLFGFLVAFLVLVIAGQLPGSMLSLGLKLVSTFPVMLVATAVALVLGLIRILAQPLRRTGVRARPSSHR